MSNPNPNGADGSMSAAERAAADDEARRNAAKQTDPRLDAMEAIERANEARINDQLLAEGLQTIEFSGDQTVGTPPPPPPPAPPAPAPAAHTPAPPAATPAPPAATPAPVRMTAEQQAAIVAALSSGQPIPMEALDGLRVRTRVDGQEVEESLYDIRRGVQLDGAAHKRLETANELLRQAKETVARASAPGAAPAPPPVGVDGKPPAQQSTPANRVTATTELVQALFTGDQDVAVARLSELLSPQQGGSDQAATVAQVAATVRQQLSVDEANAEFRSGFQDIVSDRFLTGIADGMYDEVMAENPQTDYANALIEAGNRTRAWVAAKTGTSATQTPPPPPPDKRLERRGRKESIDEVRALNRTGSTSEPEPETNTSIIAEMAKARGLQA